MIATPIYMTFSSYLMIAVPLTKNYIYSSSNKDLSSLKIVYIIIMVCFPFIFIIFFRLVLIRRARNVENVKLQRKAKTGSITPDNNAGVLVPREGRLSIPRLDMSIDSRRTSWLLYNEPQNQEQDEVKLKVDHKYCDDLFLALKFWNNNCIVEAYFN